MVPQKEMHVVHCPQSINHWGLNSYIKKLKSHLLGLRSQDQHLGYSVSWGRALGRLRKAHKGKMRGNYLCQSFLQTVDPAVSGCGS